MKQKLYCYVDETGQDTKERPEYEAAIFIDGLQLSERSKVGTGLRRIGINTEKIRGARDESDALIRLADAIAGLIREYHNGIDYAQKLVRLGMKKQILKEVAGQ